MAAKIFKRLSVKTPAELAQKAHQALVRLPYESSPERIVDELGRLLAGIKVSLIPLLQPRHATSSLVFVHLLLRCVIIVAFSKFFPFHGTGTGTF